MKPIAWLVGRGVWGCALAIGAAGCATAPAKPAPVGPPTAAPAAPAPADPGFEVSDGALVGEWAEFWAVSGGADTQRYTFWPDGRFEWQAAPGAAADPIRRRFGSWELVPGRLTLRVTGQELRPTCADQTRPCQSVREAVSSEEQLELGPCPANEEARALDASYRCMSIRGRAFWRRASPSSGGPSGP
jgi:hypothetical protein